jgi:hypothetical protein
LKLAWETYANRHCTKRDKIVLPIPWKRGKKRLVRISCKEMACLCFTLPMIPLFHGRRLNLQTSGFAKILLSYRFGGCRVLFCCHLFVAVILGWEIYTILNTHWHHHNTFLE